MFKWKIHINWRAIGFTLYIVSGVTGIVLLMGAVSVKSDEQACQEMRIMIVGEEAFVEQKDIAALIEGTYGQMVGRTLASIPIHEIEEQLTSIPYVSHARVNIDMNGVLNVGIAQRKAVLRILDEAGNGFYVDNQGLKMPVSPSYIANVPVASGQIPEPYVNPLDSIESVLVQDLYSVARVITDDPHWEQHVAQLYVNEEGEIELIPRTGNHRILLGDGQDLEAKFERLRIFYTGVMSETGPDAYNLVNVKYKDQLICVRNPLYKSVIDSAHDATAPAEVRPPSQSQRLSIH